MSNQYNAFDTLISGIYENKLPKKIAYVDEFSSYTFENLKESVEQVSYLLSDKGIVRNDRMLIAMLDRFSLPVTFLQPSSFPFTLSFIHAVAFFVFLFPKDPMLS